MYGWIGAIKINDKLLESTSKEELINRLNLSLEGDEIEKAQRWKATKTSKPRTRLRRKVN